MPVQRYNDELTGLQLSQLQGRNEMPFAWQKALSMYALLPGLRVFIPGSAFNSGGFPRDMSGNECHPDVMASHPNFDLYGLAPFMEFDGNDAFGITDRANLDITGVETNPVVGMRGITVGTWTRLETLQNSGLLTKWDSAGDQRSYALDWWNTNNAFTFHACDTGLWAAQENVGSSYAEIVDTWYFVCGTWETGGFEIFVGSGSDNVLTKNTAATTHASIFSGTANLNLGAWNEAGPLYLDGDLSLSFICAVLLPDYLIETLFTNTKRMFV